MKTRLILLILLSLFCINLFSEVVLSQGFEQSPQDTWNYTAIPQPNRLIWWGATDQPIGGATAQAGDWYWASWDLDNINHRLVFDQENLAVGYAYSISFWYFSKNLNPATEYCRYVLSYDGGVSWRQAVSLNGNTNAWAEVEIEIADYAPSVMLKVETSYDGMNKYLHWDSFALHKEERGPTAPTVYNVQASQRIDGSKLIDVYYQVFDANSDDSTISVFVSFDGGLNYEYQPSPQNLSGDFGENIPSGTNGHIVWNAGAEGISFDCDSCCIIVKAEDYTTNIVATPIFDPAGGVFYQPQTVSISCATLGANIYYSLDGSDPDESSTLYTSPITIASNTTLKARAYKELWQSSEIAEMQFLIYDRFVFVPGGTFTMGRTKGAGESWELPFHNVTLNSFYMNKYHVTQSEYAQYMQPALSWTSDNGIGDNYPAYYVSWYAILKYCNLRSIAEGLTPVYSISGSTNPANWGPVPTDDYDYNWEPVICNWSANGYRLPTEAEWEYAARGATNNPDYFYSGSDNIDAVAWYEGNNSPPGSKPVGSKAPNALGIYDMSGNLYEWCWDWFGDYGSSPANNPAGPGGGIYRMVRGGFWLSPASWNRVAFRAYFQPYGFGYHMGFRVCRSRL